jgi:hypothetical protein
LKFESLKGFRKLTVRAGDYLYRNLYCFNFSVMLNFNTHRKHSYARYTYKV